MGDKTVQSGSGTETQRSSALPMTGRFDPNQLWSYRAAAFRKEMIPYSSYVARSGFPGVIMLGLIVAAIGYSMLVRDVPAHFPFTLFGLVLTIGFVCWSPLRSWLQPADTVFLLPQEAAMTSYIRRSIRYNTLAGLIGVWASLLIYWPMYSQGEGQAGALLLFIALTVLKVANTAGAWQERRASEAGARRLLRFARWVLSGLTLAALYQLEPWKAFILGMLAAVLYALACRLPRKHPFPWDTLIREETRTRRRYYRFMALFIDVPTQAPRIARRRYLSWIGGRIPYAQRGTYHYLYAMTMFRTELGGMLVRLTLLGMLVLYWLGEAVWLDGWGACAVYALFAAIIGLQLGALRHSHKYAVWAHIYPLPNDRRTTSLIVVDRTAFLIIAILLWLPCGIVLAVQEELIPALLAPAVILLYAAVVRPGGVRRKVVKETEED
ncbi:ABC transporter permease [Paenibacillus xylaniclasticus]|uniref:ABC transporter permease n=1 Tax=Paenibacillus xylaniclasticus TaxID=588083 RepID=UPI000FDBECF5|nr:MULTISPECIES: ABC transporter permease [Paenibacillus]GFN30983.1 protein EcsB [Paenibacillus curdlanolyticus]